MMARCYLLCSRNKQLWNSALEWARECKHGSAGTKRVDKRSKRSSVHWLGVTGEPFCSASTGLTDIPFFSASTGKEEDKRMDRSSAQRLELTDEPFLSENTGFNGYTVLQCKHWIGLWQTARPFFSNCWLGWEAASCRQGRHTKLSLLYLWLVSGVLQFSTY